MNKVSISHVFEAAGFRLDSRHKFMGQSVVYATHTDSGHSVGVALPPHVDRALVVYHCTDESEFVGARFGTNDEAKRAAIALLAIDPDLSCEVERLYFMLNAADTFQMPSYENESSLDL